MVRQMKFPLGDNVWKIPQIKCQQYPGLQAYTGQFPFIMNKMIKENINRRSCHGHHGSKRRELAQHNTRTHVDRTHSLTHLHQHSYNHFVPSASSAIIFQCMLGIEIEILLRRYLREGEQTVVTGEKPRQLAR